MGSKLKLTSVDDSKGSSWAQQAVRASIHAGVGGLVISRKGAKGGLVWRVTKIIRKSNGNTTFKRQDLYNINKSGKIQIKKPKHFMREAAIESARLMIPAFKKAAERQFKQVLK